MTELQFDSFRLSAKPCSVGVTAAGGRPLCCWSVVLSDEKTEKTWTGRSSTPAEPRAAFLDAIKDLTKFTERAEFPTNATGLRAAAEIVWKIWAGGRDRPPPGRPKRFAAPEWDGVGLLMPKHFKFT